MAKQLTGGSAEFVFELVNAGELNKLFLELQTSVQIKVLEGAFRKAGKPILTTAKSNFNATKQGLSRTGYAMLSKAFKAKVMKKEIGMVFGMQHREGYKYRFLNFGTKERFTRKNGRFSGVIKPSKFFTNAVESTAGTVQSTLSKEIILSLERTVKKYDKKASW